MWQYLKGLSGVDREETSKVHFSPKLYMGVLLDLNCNI